MRPVKQNPYQKPVPKLFRGLEGFDRTVSRKSQGSEPKSPKSPTEPSRTSPTAKQVSAAVEKAKAGETLSKAEAKLVLSKIKDLVYRSGLHTQSSDLTKFKDAVKDYLNPNYDQAKTISPMKTSFFLWMQGADDEDFEKRNGPAIRKALEALSGGATKFAREMKQDQQLLDGLYRAIR